MSDSEIILFSTESFSLSSSLCFFSAMPFETSEPLAMSYLLKSDHWPSANGDTLKHRFRDFELVLIIIRRNTFARTKLDILGIENLN